MKKIMIVDDEIVIATQLEERLKAMKFDVPGICASGEEAIEMARSLKPDLILMDIVMPGKLDGIEAADRIHDEMKIPVIFVTAFADDELIERAKSTVPFGYILKPFQDREIRAAIEIGLFKKDMEDRLQKAHDELEERVEERTKELTEVNKKLIQEIKSKEEAYKLLQQQEQELEDKSDSLEKANVALSVMLKKRDEEKVELEEKVLVNVKELVMPIMQELKLSKLTVKQKAYVEILENNLNEVISPFISRLSSKYLCLTPSEIRIASLVKQGKTTKEIAEIMKTSARTVDNHRFSIRKKLGIKNTRKNLATHLLSLE